jgi:hypothetical protein
VSVRKGLTLEEPSIRIPWGIRQPDLRALFADTGGHAGLRLVTQGYYVARCRALGGLDTQVGFHFRPQSENGILAELEFFDSGQRQLEASYKLYQQHLEQVFGPPSRTQGGSFSAELPSHEWRWSCPDSVDSLAMLRRLRQRTAFRSPSG